MVNPMSVQSYMDLPKAVWTSNPISIKFHRVLKYGLERIEVREWLDTYSNRNHRQLPIIYRELTEDFPKIFQVFSGNIFGLILTKLGFE